MAATNSVRLRLDLSAVLAAARNLIDGMVDCIPSPRPPPAGSPFSTKPVRELFKVTRLGTP
jgi:hypothetical protein